MEGRVADEHNQAASSQKILPRWTAMRTETAGEYDQPLSRLTASGVRLARSCRVCLWSVLSVNTPSYRSCGADAGAAVAAVDGGGKEHTG
jgi:hypothetical protein